MIQRPPPQVAPAPPGPAASRSGRRSALLHETALIAPAAILLIVFLILPFFMAGYLSFTNERLVPRPIPTRFVGFENYTRVLGDPDFWQAFRNTFYFALLVVPLQLSMSLGAAMLLNGRLRFRSFFRSVALLPLVTPITVIIVIWAAMFQIPDGLLNTLIRLFGYRGDYVNWLGDARWAMPSIVLLSAWATFPFQMLIYLAGLQDIPIERYEAARIDGANTWAQFRYITLTGLRNVHVFVVITTTIQAFKLFVQVDLLTRGGPLGSTNTLVSYMVQEGYSAQRIGYASAIAIIFFILVTTFALLQRVLIPND